MPLTHPFCSVSLRVSHPTINPEDITAQLSLVPRFSWKQGARRKTPTGRLLDGVYDKSYWCFCYPLQPEVSLRDFLLACTEQIAHCRDLFHRIDEEGGKSEFYVTLKGNINAGDELEWDMLSRLVELRINLAIEIIPVR